MFKDEGFPRDSKKGNLAKYILYKYQSDDVIPIIGNWKKVLDGGILLHSIPWQVGCTFESILDSYVSYVNHMTDNIDIIFEGYLDSNTKRSLSQEIKPNLIK